jgi:hypothetical protein
MTHPLKPYRYSDMASHATGAYNGGVVSGRGSTVWVVGCVVSVDVVCVHVSATVTCIIAFR